MGVKDFCNRVNPIDRDAAAGYATRTVSGIYTAGPYSTSTEPLTSTELRPEVPKPKAQGPAADPWQSITLHSLFSVSSLRVAP